METKEYVWIFTGGQSVNGLPSAVFVAKELAEEWIKLNKLSGMLTKYPVNKPIFDWAIENNFFVPKNEFQKNAKAIANFSSAYLEHYHYQDGE